MSYKLCDVSWCGSSISGCENCDGDAFIFLEDGERSSCLSHWSSSTNNLNACCDAMELRAPRYDFGNFLPWSHFSYRFLVHTFNGSSLIFIIQIMYLFSTGLYEPMRMLHYFWKLKVNTVIGIRLFRSFNDLLNIINVWYYLFSRLLLEGMLHDQSKL